MPEKHLQEGFYDKAVETCLTAMKTIGVDPKIVTLLKDAHTASGWKGFWRKELELVTAKTPGSPLFPYLTAKIHARLGENDRALGWLEVAYKERLDHLVLLKMDPVFKPLRSDPQFKDLLRRIGFEDEP